MKQSALIHAKTLSFRQLLQKAVCSLLIISLLTESAPAAPAMIVSMADNTWQEARFAFLSSKIAIDLPNWSASFFGLRGNTAQTKHLSRIQIYPGPVTIRQGSKVVFAALGFDSQNEPLSGLSLGEDLLQRP